MGVELRGGKVRKGRERGRKSESELRRNVMNMCVNLGVMV